MNASNVTTGKPNVSGAVYVAPAGTSLPESALTAVGSTFKELGYVSEDGVTNANTITSESIKAWGGDTVGIVQTGKEDTYNFKLIESTNVEVLKTIFGSANVTGTLATEISIAANSGEQEAHAWIFDMILKGGYLKRICIPSATITELEDIVYKDNEAIGYGITIEATPDADGNTHYEYIAKPTTPPGSPS